MHAILITFTTDLSLTELEVPFTQFADSLQTVSGLISKAWVQESDTVVGGFYLFTDEASAATYLSSDLVTSLQATEGFSDFAVRRFRVLEDLSARTGVAPITIA